MERSESDFSVFVSSTLDTMGYSSSMVKDRREAFAERSSIVSQKKVCRADGIITGSKGEGVTRYGESDIDAMSVNKNYLCVEDVAWYSPHNNLLFQIDRRHIAPGYARLSPLNDEIERANIELLVETDAGIKYLSSSAVKNIFLDKFPRYFTGSQGPSACHENVAGMPCDKVYAFRCDCPSVLTSWLTRRRQRDWPTQQTIQEISTLDAHVVPVGYKRSSEPELEWRICYTLAELTLVHSFNDTQTKLYILLKCIAKAVLKPVCKGMTSYVMKNILFWFSELTESSNFRPDLLIDRLIRCLRLLAMSIATGRLPSYMIPERNLLHGTLRPTERSRLLRVLADLVDERGNMLLRCGKMKLSLMKMYRSPDSVRKEGEKKDELERLVLLGDTYVFEKLPPDRPVTQVSDLCEQISQIPTDDMLAGISHQVRECADILMTDEQRFQSRDKCKWEKIVLELLS